ncbi:MAG: hypothetical protein R3E84_04705 [Pseudomonadales bacterium]
MHALRGHGVHTGRLEHRIQESHLVEALIVREDEQNVGRVFPAAAAAHANSPHSTRTRVGANFAITCMLSPVSGPDYRLPHRKMHPSSPDP